MRIKGTKFGSGLIVTLIVSLIVAMPAFASQPNDYVEPPYDPLDPIIDNGTVQLGVHPEGNLNVPGGTPSMEYGTAYVGLRYIPTNGESTAPGCLCEGWGVANADEGTGIFSGYANVAVDGVNNLIRSPETGITNTSGKTQPESEGSAFKSVVTTSGRLKITHDYKPSASPNLYVSEVTIENIGEETVGDLRYRRVMDWDIAPKTFLEHVEIHVGNAANVIQATTDGFLSANPLSSSAPLVGSPPATLYPGSPDHMSTSPSDQGSLFDFGFGALAPGKSRTFNIYYGAAETRDEAFGALSTVGAEVYSFGIPSNDDGTPALNGPHIFIFAFGSVGGEPVDAIAPTTQLLANSAAPAAWYKSDNISVQLNAEDNPSGSGIDKTFYKVNGGTLQEYTGPFTLSGSGSYTVDYYSADLAGNVETAKSVTLKVDTIAPVTKFSAVPIWVNEGGKRYIKGYTVTLKAADNLSGVKQTLYRINGGGWKVYTGPFSLSGSSNTSLDFYSVDNAGNVETPN
jgi:hypothetical protein